MIRDKHNMSKIYELTTQDGEIRYVGQTISTLPKRKSRHKSVAIKGKCNAHVYNWMRSVYTKGEDVLIRLVEECKDEIGNEREEYWIKEYKSRGINLTNTQSVGKRNYKPGIVKWTEKQKLEIKERAIVANRKFQIPILLYNLDGKFYKEFLGVGEALRHIGVEQDDHAGVKRCCNGKYNQVYGYMWRYKVDEDYPLEIEPYHCNRMKRIEQLDMDDRIVNKFNSIKEAVDILGLTDSARKHISSCCNGKRKTCSGFKWRHYSFPSQISSASVCKN